MSKNSKGFLYFAYGANTNILNMAHRCPKAIPLGVVRLFDYKLVFRGVADVVKHSGSHVEGVIWSTTEDCIESLDHYEGYPYLYTKQFVKVLLGEKQMDTMFYRMNRFKPVSAPSALYEKMVREGYRDFNLDISQLDTALAQSKIGTNTEITY